MKTLTAAAALLLMASSVLAAEAPCQKPSTLPCQRACAIMGAKLALSLRQESLEARAQERAGRTANPVATADLTSLDTDGIPESALRLAHFAGLSLQYIDGMPLRDIRSAIEKSCPR